MTARRGRRRFWRRTRSARCRCWNSRTDGGSPSSNAILLHLAEGTPYLPPDAFDRAKAYEWLFFEQYVHEPSIAVRRSILTAPERAHLRTPERLAELLEAGNRALAIMELRLSKADWLAGQGYSVADMALYAYTHVAEEGGYDLSAFPGVSAWIARVAGQPGHVPIDWRPVAE